MATGLFFRFFHSTHPTHPTLTHTHSPTGCDTATEGGSGDSDMMSTATTTMAGRGEKEERDRQMEVEREMGWTGDDSDLALGLGVGFGASGGETTATMTKENEKKTTKTKKKGEGLSIDLPPSLPQLQPQSQPQPQRMPLESDSHPDQDRGPLTPSRQVRFEDVCIVIPDEEEEEEKSKLGSLSLRAIPIQIQIPLWSRGRMPVSEHTGHQQPATATTNMKKSPPLPSPVSLSQSPSSPSMMIKLPSLFGRKASRSPSVTRSSRARSPSVSRSPPSSCLVQSFRMRDKERESGGGQQRTGGKVMEALPLYHRVPETTSTTTMHTMNANGAISPGSSPVIPLRACCVACEKVVDEASVSEEWEEKFSRGAERRRRSASLEQARKEEMAATFASSSFGAYGNGNVNGYGKKFEEVPIKVDEVAPVVPVLLPLPSAVEEMGAFAHRSSPIQEEDDESMLFPLPSPTRRSTPSPTPSSTHSLSGSRSSSRTPSPLPSPSHLSPTYSPSHSPLPPHSPLHSPLPSHPHSHSQSPLLSHPSPLQAFKRSSPRLSPRASPRASPAGSQESLLRASLSRKVSPGGWLEPLEDERGAKEREEKTKEKEEVKEREDKKEERVNGKERGKENGKEEVVFIRTPASPEEEKEKALPDLPKREDVQVELKTRNGHGKSVSDGPRGFGTGPTVPLKTWPEAEKEMTSPKLLPTSPKLTSTSPPLSAINRRRSASASQSPTSSSSPNPNSSSPRIPGRRKLSLSQSFAAPFLKAGGAIRDVGADVLKGVSGMGGMGGMSGMGGVPGGVGGG